MNEKITIVCTVIVLALLPLAGVISCAAPTPAPEPAIPAHFITYTEENLFSISYPQDWEVDLSLIEEFEKSVKEYLESIELGAPSEEERKMIFITGIRKEAGYYNPSVWIMVGQLSEGETIDEWLEVTVKASKEFLGEDFKEFSRVKTTVGRREAILQEIEMKLPKLKRIHNLGAHMLVDRVHWAVICSTSPEEFSYYEEDFHAIIRNFEILR